MRKDFSLALSANTTRDSPWGWAARGPPAATFALTPLLSIEQQSKRGWWEVTLQGH